VVILLTGGSGFIGRNLIERLGARHKVVAPTSGELNLLDEVAVRDFLRDCKPDAIVHSATTPGHRNAPDVQDLVARNLRMFFNLARNQRYFGKMLYLGSGAIYDSRHYQPRMKEDYFDVHVPADPHGFSKYVIAKYLESAPRIIELRLFGVFGKYEDYAIRFISNAICKTLFGLPITLRQNRRFDYLYANDLTPILEHFFSVEPSENVFNVTPDRTIDLLTLGNYVGEIAGTDLEVVVGQGGMGLEYSGDNTRLRQEMQHLVFTSIEDAIRELYDWYRERKDQLDRDLLLVDK